MRALVKESAGPGIVLRDVPVPACGPSEVLIRVHHAGVCGTDLHIWEWDSWASGRLKLRSSWVMSSPARSPSWGRRLQPRGCSRSATWSPRRATSSADTASNAASATPTSVAGPRSSASTAMAPSPITSSMPASNVMKLDGIPTEIGAIMDPMGNAVHTVLEAEVPGSTVLVLGCGPIGCFAVGVARAAGASLVIASDFNPNGSSWPAPWGRRSP